MKSKIVGLTETSEETLPPTLTRVGVREPSHGSWPSHLKRLPNGEVLNTSGIRPLGHACLVVPYDPDARSSVILIPETASERALMVGQRAIFIEAGPAAWLEEIQQGLPPRAKPGDRIMITKLCGHFCQGTLDDQKYRLVNDMDIFAGFEEKEDGRE